MKKIFALVAVAMVSATAFVSCTEKGASVEALKELAAADSADTTAILAMVETLKADTTICADAAAVATIDSIAALFTVVEEEVIEETECCGDSICGDSVCADTIEATETVAAEVAE